MLLAQPCVDNSFSQYESWPVDQDHLMFTQYNCPSSSSAYPSGSHQPLPNKNAYAEYQLSQLGMITEEVYSSWNSLPEDSSCLYNNYQMAQESCFVKQMDGYPLDSTSTYMTGYPTTAYAFGYTIDSQAAMPMDFNPMSQTQLPYGTPYGDVYCLHSGKWEQDDFSQYAAMPGLISSANSVASLSPLSDTQSWQACSMVTTPFTEEDDEEPLQALGLYDFPDLAMDEIYVDPKRFSFGKGLKLEESFEFEDESYEEDEEDEEEDDE